MTKNVVYARGVQKDNPFEWKRAENVPVEWKLDEYAPTQAGHWPAVVLVHGSQGDKRDWATVAKMIAGQGAMVFAIAYPDAEPETAIALKGRGYREMADSVACAVRFARAKASADTGSDAVPVALVGFSLGGGIAAQVALAGDSSDRRWDAYAAAGGGPPRQVGCTVTEGTTRVDAFVGIAGAYDAFLGTEGAYGRAWMRQKDPYLWKMVHAMIGENPALKIRLLHSKTDSVIPYDNSVAFETPLAAAGYDVKLSDFTGEHEAPPEVTLKTIMSLIGNQSK